MKPNKMICLSENGRGNSCPNCGAMVSYHGVPVPHIQYWKCPKCGTTGATTSEYENTLHHKAHLLNVQNSAGIPTEYRSLIVHKILTDYRREDVITLLAEMVHQNIITLPESEIEPMDSEGYSCDALCYLHETAYPVYLSYANGGTYEAQAAKQLYGYMDENIAAAVNAYAFQDPNASKFRPEWVAKEEKSREAITPHAVFENICKALPQEPKAPFWSTGDLILAYDAPRANAIAGLIDAMGGVGLTGYYDPAEDKRSGEVDRCTGWHYVDIE